MYDLDTRKNVLTLVAQGRSLSSVSRQTGISRSAIREWQARVEPLPRMSGQAAPCPRCLPVPGVPADTAAYAYLLGLYLGDAASARTAAAATTCASRAPMPGRA